MAAVPHPKPSPAPFFPAGKPAPRGRFAAKKGAGSGAPLRLAPRVRMRAGRHDGLAIAGHRPLRQRRRLTMTAIGFVTRTIDGGFQGQLKLLPICADIDIVPNRDKAGDIPQTSASSPKGSRSDPGGF